MSDAVESETADGDCFIAALHQMFREPDSSWLVHGTVWHPETGRHSHAWVERDGSPPDELRNMFDEHEAAIENMDWGIVVDVSNGLDVEMPRVAYYALGHCEVVRRYRGAEAWALAVREGHYGPWEDDDAGMDR